MPRHTKHVRVTLTVEEELQAMCDRARRSHTDRGGPCWWQSDDGPTLGEMINHLVTHVVNDKRRQREAAYRRKVRDLNDLWERRYGLA